MDHHLPQQPTPTSGRTVINWIGKVLAFLVILVTMDALVGFGLRQAYFTQKFGVLSRITYVMDETSADGLIMGSSRASHHFITDSLTRSTGMPFYNAGKDGQSIFYHYAMLKGVLERYTPKVIVLDLLNDELYNKIESYDRLSELLPYCRDHRGLDFVPELRGPYEQLKMKSSVYPFNSLLVSIANGNAGITRDKFVEKNGYLPLFGEYKGSLNDHEKDRPMELDSNKIRIYREFIRECEVRKIKLYVTISPYLKSQPDNSSINMVKQIAAEHKVPFYDFSRDEHFVQQPQFFWDKGHLNNNGATLFTKMISKTLI